MRRSLVLSLAVLGFSSAALAEVGGSLPGTLAAPEFSGLKPSGTVLRGTDGTTVTLTTATGPSGTQYVKIGTAQLPTLNPALAGRLFSGLIGADAAQPLADYLNRPEVQLALGAGLTADADPYDVTLKSTGKGLTMTVVLHQQSGFAPVPANRVLGDPAAPHVIRMYSDLQCPYCQKAELEALPDVLKALPKDVRFEFHHIPLTQIHPNAYPAAEASVCAANQGKFFAFKDALFHRNDWQRAANPAPVFTQAAQAVGLNLQTYASCVSAHAGKAEVDAGIAEADRLELKGTPTVYIDGYQVQDPYTATSYLSLLDFVRAK